MSRYIDKVCPVILRGPSQTSEILAFQHPSAGIQIVKGTLEPGERPEEGVVRELAEESGIEDAVVVESIGELDLDSVGHHWYVFSMRVSKTSRRLVVILYLGRRRAQP